MDHRKNWLNRLDRIASPVFLSLADKQLKLRMPVEHHPTAHDRTNYTHLEAFARTFAGLAPWLELDPAHLDDTEKSIHQTYRQRAVECLGSALDPKSPDYCNFTTGQQPLVDTAFLAHAVVRAPEWFHSLDRPLTDHLIQALQSTRRIKPFFSNWLLFSAMIEVGLFNLTGECDPTRIDYALRQHEQWYKGDGVYGDGPSYKADFYNSFVIQPMLVDILRTVRHLDTGWEKMFDPVIQRAKRYAEIQERMILSDGSYPPLGRSITYRCGAFQHLAQMALLKALPENLRPAQVRCALSACIARTLDAPETFDDQGWLRIGLCGHQPSLGEQYISTGSLYLCSTAFLPLGLPPQDPFWTDPDLPFSSQKAWNGTDLQADHGIS